MARYTESQPDTAPMTRTEKLLDLWRITAREFLRLTANPGVMLIFFGGVLLYGLLYNYMYGTNRLYDTPIAVVDESMSFESRELCRRLEATERVRVLTTTLSFTEAQALMRRQEIRGIVCIPPSFADDIGRGIATDIGAYISADAFLYYANIALAVNLVALDYGQELSLGKATVDRMTPPIDLFGASIYNPSEGYGTFLLPVAMIIILHQTLILGIGLMAGTESEERHYGELAARVGVGRRRRGADLFRIVFGKAICYVALYAVLTYYMLGLLPLLFDLPQLGELSDLICLLLPFLLATTFFGMALSLLFKTYESPLLLFVFTSVPLVLLSGVSYPLESIPWVWRLFHYILPGPTAAMGLVRIETMGANCHQIEQEIYTLWIQTIVYLLLAMVSYHRLLRNQPTDELA